MCARAGRPKLPNPKDVDIKVRIDSDMNQKLIEYCKANALTRAETMRRGLECLLEQEKK